LSGRPRIVLFDRCCASQPPENRTEQPL
jgi:hypothetical protein